MWIEFKSVSWYVFNRDPSAGNWTPHVKNSMARAGRLLYTDMVCTPSSQLDAEIDEEDLIHFHNVKH